MHTFEAALCVSIEDIEFRFQGHEALMWPEFLLNPRRLRGSDFLMRWSQGVWSEERLVQAVNETGKYFALPYGPSGTAPDDDPRAFELYFERLERAGLAGIKRPDLLIFTRVSRKRVNELVRGVGGVRELPFTPEDHDAIRELLSLAVIAVECETACGGRRTCPRTGLP